MILEKPPRTKLAQNDNKNETQGNSRWLSQEGIIYFQKWYTFGSVISLFILFLFFIKVGGGCNLFFVKYFIELVLIQHAILFPEHQVFYA